MPKKIITIFVQSHGEDIVDPMYKIPRNVRMLSAAGIPGCFNFGNAKQRKFEEEIANAIVATERMQPDFTTYKILVKLRSELIRFEEMRGYEGLNDLMDQAINPTRPSSRYIPLDESGLKIAKKRTEHAIHSEKRFKIIKSTTQHKYSFVPKPREKSEQIPDGIYVIDSTNNPDSLLKFGDNLAEHKFDINEQGLRSVPVSSINDIRDNHINYVRRKFGPYLALANLYNDGEKLSPFKSEEEVSEWVTNYYNPVNNIYKFGCMKLLQTGTNPRELKALMCATFLGEKFFTSNSTSTKSNQETDIFTLILNRFNNLTDALKPRFITGLSPDEFEKILSKYHVSSNPSFVGTEWEKIRAELIEYYTSMGSISNRMIHVPAHNAYDNENIEETYISQLIKYLKGLGYDGINIVDFSCRVNTSLTEDQLKEHEANEDNEEISPRSKEWGGKKTQSKRRLKKTRGKKSRGKQSI